MAAVLSVLSSLMVGLILLVAPWTTLWESNYLLQPHPTLRALMLNTFIRGSVSGIGLINIVLAVYEVLQHLGKGARPRRG